MRIAILRDSIPEIDSPDEVDNLYEANFAEKCLSPKHDIIQIPFVPNIKQVIEDIKAFKPDVIFNLVESVLGCGALSAIAVQVFETMHIPFTGNPIYPHIISADKDLAKEVMIKNNIPTPTTKFKTGSEYILKAQFEHASINLDDSCILSFNSGQEMRKALKAKREQTGMDWVAEEYIDGREFNCAFLGDLMLPPEEIRYEEGFTGHKVLTYEAKWNEESDSYNLSLRHFDIESFIKEQLFSITSICKEKLGMKGYARIDFRMDKKGYLYVIDINTNPCISPDSGFAAMAHEVGISDEEIFNIIVNEAIKDFKK